MSDDYINLAYPSEIKSIINGFQDLMASTLGWSYLIKKYGFKPDDLKIFIKKYETNDRMAFASDTLRQQANEYTKVSFSFIKHLSPFLAHDFNPNKYLSKLHAMMFGHCWEVMKKDYFDRTGKKLNLENEPVIQFARHVRNASFHGNHFDIRGDLATLPAAWQHWTLTSSDNGKKLFSDGEDEKFFINWGDIYVLLYDLSERVYPSKL